ncbi:hypothetical protein JKP88DRAFT_253781 [Tribonema minus]|uniref:Uncharacterized protein n=1 Tax=Tribonema minus TaxID=303371 RepID=A0A835Z607_9STRA|nr:hypothetical protein JKP88DRAFT_253781 [Tribonema minus]
MAAASALRKKCCFKSIKLRSDARSRLALREDGMPNCTSQNTCAQPALALRNRACERTSEMAALCGPRLGCRMYAPLRLWHRSAAVASALNRHRVNAQQPSCQRSTRAAAQPGARPAAARRDGTRQVLTRLFGRTQRHSAQLRASQTMHTGDMRALDSHPVYGAPGRGGAGPAHQTNDGSHTRRHKYGSQSRRHKSCEVVQRRCIARADGPQTSQNRFGNAFSAGRALVQFPVEPTIVDEHWGPALSLNPDPTTARP